MSMSSTERETGLGLRTGAASARETLIVVGVLVVVWELIARLVVEIPLILPAPSIVWSALVDNVGLYLRESAYTLYEVGLGFIAGVALGFFSGVGIYYSPLLRRFLYPVLLGIRIVPKVAFVPLFIVWFGAGVWSKIALAAFGIFFLVLVQTLLGLRGTDAKLIDLGRSLQMNERLMFRKLRLPSALPAIMVGMKLSITYALTLVVVAEMTVARHGVGWIIIDTKARFQTAEMLGGIVMVAIAGLGLYALGIFIEKRTTFWNVEERQ